MHLYMQSQPLINTDTLFRVYIQHLDMKVHKTTYHQKQNPNSSNLAVI